MKKPLRVLLVEDSTDDERLLRRQLQKADYQLVLHRVDTEDGLRAIMPPELWDVVIADFGLGQDFDGLDALRIVREYDEDIPFFLLSGTVGEETAVAAMKAGASDYIMKDKSARLPQAIERELRQAEGRREKRRVEQQMDYYARHDVLTGLLNRLEFDAQLQYLLQDAKANDRRHALMYMDLDQFKTLNDTVGHVAGDAMLQQVAKLMTRFIRARTDMVARLGGDEFGLLMRDCEMERAVEVADHLREAIQSFRFEWESRIFSISISIGIAPISTDSVSTITVLSAADTACYSAKSKGRNQVHVYKHDDSDTLRQHYEMRLALAIPEALRNGEFRLYHQPIVAIHSGAKKSGGEVLLRMLDSKGALIFPDMFIPAAERYDLMTSVDRWVVRSVLEWITVHLGELDQKRQFSINLSGRSISDPTFLSFLLAELDASEVDANRICFEITETAAVGKLRDAANFITILGAKGCGFALDDFGSGMCSFTYLKNLPVHYLKIDGSFVKDVASDQVARSIVESVNNIAHALGMQTIAESVENNAILAVLEELGVDYAQGDGIAAPAPIDAILLTL